MTSGKCLKCHKKTRLTAHHIYPVCHYGSENNWTVMWLCVECHRELERLISKKEGIGPRGLRNKLTKSQYFRIAEDFISEVIK
jgi:DNA-directed RNA polymerase subunit RPC12/RpoP